MSKLRNLKLQDVQPSSMMYSTGNGSGSEMHGTLPEVVIYGTITYGTIVYGSWPRTCINCGSAFDVWGMCPACDYGSGSGGSGSSVMGEGSGWKVNSKVKKLMEKIFQKDGANFYVDDYIDISSVGYSDNYFQFEINGDTIACRGIRIGANGRNTKVRMYSGRPTTSVTNKDLAGNTVSKTYKYTIYSDSGSSGQDFWVTVDSSGIGNFEKNAY